MADFFDTVNQYTTIGGLSKAVFGADKAPTMSAIVGTRIILGDVDKMHDLYGSAVPPFEFLETEAPERLPIGSSKMMAMHEFPGGGRSADIFGSQPKTIEFSGHLYSINVDQLTSTDQRELMLSTVGPHQLAVERAKHLQKFEQLQLPVRFSFHTYDWMVIVREVPCVIHHANHVEYTLRMEVLVDNTNAYRPTTNIKDAQELQYAPPAEAALQRFSDWVVNFTQFSQLVATFIGAVNKLAVSAMNDPAGIMWAGARALPGTRDAIAAYEALTNLVTTAIPIIQDQAEQAAVDMQAAQPYDTLDPEEVANLVKQFQQLATDIKDAQGTAYKTDDPDVLAACCTVINKWQAQTALVGKDLHRLIAEDKAFILHCVNPNLIELAARYYPDDPDGWFTIAAANGLNTPRPAGVFDLVIPGVWANGASK